MKAVRIPRVELKFHGHLTKREVETVAMLAQGFNHREIAKQFFISDQTVTTHIKNAREKTGARNAMQLVRHAIDTGLIKVEPKNKPK
jgi:DNA-binding NarL/FixJ family response regulator